MSFERNIIAQVVIVQTHPPLNAFVPFLDPGADLVALPSCLLLLLAGPKVERALPLAWTGICYELKCPCVQEEQPLAGGSRFVPL